MAYLILIAPPDLAIVPEFAASVVAAIPVILLLTGGALLGDALGSFAKRRLNMESGRRVLLLDQLPFVAVPILLGALFYPALFVPVFFTLAGLFWVLVFTLGLHTLFNWLGYRMGTKSVPW
jgi:CDP-2,3-bis-(O-geranylgeranyl)-sn-glycerol synthase